MLGITVFGLSGFPLNEDPKRFISERNPEGGEAMKLNSSNAV